MIDYLDQHIGGGVISMEMYDYIKFSHYKLGHSIRKIHRQTGLDRKTIRRALAGPPPAYQLKQQREKTVVGHIIKKFTRIAPRAL